ncbi:MAG: family 20 glycosylhydrolase [Bacilli bacterium]|nr:family 20 glycosylhydrolase [Bacilli bacterium]
MAKFEVLSAFIECSGGATPTVESIKRYAKILKGFGYQELYLGLGNGYKMDKYPYFAYRRGRYTIEDMKAIDSYCKEIGITVIPNIQLLGHQPYLFRFDSMRHLMDTPTVLLVGYEKTYELIDEMFKTMTQGFSSQRIHISLDEAFGIGSGRYLEFNEPKDKKAILLEHLLRVKEIAKKYGCDIEMWGDGLIDRVCTKVTAKDVKNALPPHTLVWQWDYCEFRKDAIRKMISTIQENATDLGYAGCAWKHSSLAPNNAYSIKRLLPQMDVAEEMGVKRFMVTVWEDRGLPVSFLTVLPALFVAAQYNEGRDIREGLDKQKFYEVTGISYDDIFSIEYMNYPSKKKMNESWATISEYLTLCDIFITNYDFYVKEKTGSKYAALSRRYANIACPDYMKPMFTYYSSLAKYLSKKARLGTEVREAYLRKDNESLKTLMNGKLSQAIKTLKKAYQDLVSYWPSEFQILGLETNQMFFLHVIGRLEYAKEKIKKYLLDGTKIDEIEEELLPPDIVPQLDEEHCNAAEPAYFFSNNLINFMF